MRETMKMTFDQAAAIWVVRHYPDATPELGSVEFSMDSAAYESSAWSRFEVSWQEVIPYHRIGETATRPRTEVIDDEAWNYDATDLMRELFEISENT